MAANRTYEEVLAALDAMGARQGATNRSAPLPTGGPGRYGTSFVQEGGKLGISDADAAIAAAMQQAIDSGASAGELAQMLPALSEKYGVGPRSVPLNEILAAVKYRDERAARGGRGPSGITARPAQTPLTSAQRADIAELNDPSNAYDAKFGNVISAGLAPDIAGLVSPDLERRMRESQQYYADASPWASLGGEMAGYIAPSTAFSKLMNPAALALATDVVLPTAIGAGENPNDRVGGAANSFLENMLVAGPANVAGIKLGDLASAYLHGRAAPDIGDITTEEGLDATRSAERAAVLERARAQGFNTDLPLYHGSSSDFSVFSPNREIFLTDRPDVANIYATARGEDKARKYGPAINGEPNVRPVFARMQNPLVVSDVGPDGGHGWLTDNMAAALGLDTATGPKVRGRALYDEARRQGYDTVQIKNMLDLGGEQTQYVPLSPEHVRSQFDTFQDATPSDLSVPTGPLALPAPPQQLALPAPGPGLPSFAAKPRGGQWWPDAPLGPGGGYYLSPEEAARSASQGMGLRTIRWEPEVPGDLRPMLNPSAVEKSPEQAWMEKALAKYYKTDFGAPTDPLRDLAERGLHYDPDMTPEAWQKTVNDYLMADPIGTLTVPGTPGYQAEDAAFMAKHAPWLAKQPVTDPIYGISSGGLDLSHFTDEFANALSPETSGLPMDLAVRPESLQRMSFPQAVEHVGRINQFRAKQAEQAALSALDSPVVQTFKEYPENNPLGLRWAEIAPPRAGAPTNYDPEAELAAALKYEGDTMGHCVGGYCPDVLSGRSRIFSLRDAKGEPHVTIETKPTDRHGAAVEHLRSLGVLPDWQEYITSTPGLLGKDKHDIVSAYLQDRGLPPVDYSGQNIIQIKGKQNRAPKDDYLPFVQDFVKSGQWGNVGDLGNTGLVRLPDGRYITAQQAEEGIAAIPDAGVYDPSAFQYMGPTEWQGIAPHFEGYAIGGRVERDRCFCQHPFSAKG